MVGSGLHFGSDGDDSRWNAVGRRNGRGRPGSSPSAKGSVAANVGLGCRVASVVLRQAVLALVQKLQFRTE
ncbi:hypothetical protein CASFOL_016788 [Castilleja foliolosa]|uniref:Uncharacterized protein n=1 Tax=Castilleja foliolosa TaxID=1961234 RepID=A0ABD3DBB0_9LAMI